MHTSSFRERIQAALAATITNGMRRRCRKHPSFTQAIRQGPTRRDRLIFGSRFPALATLAETLSGQHYLDLNEADRAAVRELLSEIQEHRQRPPRRRPPDHPTFRDDQECRDRLAGLKSALADQFPRLLFATEALRRLLNLDCRLRCSFEKQFVLLAAGHLDDKHDVPGSRPKLFVREASRHGRVYYRRASRDTVLIQLIGTTHTKTADYLWMRQKLV